MVRFIGGLLVLSAIASDLRMRMTSSIEIGGPVVEVKDRRGERSVDEGLETLPAGHVFETRLWEIAGQLVCTTTFRFDVLLAQVLGRALEREEISRGAAQAVVSRRDLSRAVGEAAEEVRAAIAREYSQVEGLVHEQEWISNEVVGQARSVSARRRKTRAGPPVGEVRSGILRLHGDLTDDTLIAVPLAATVGDTIRTRAARLRDVAGDPFPSLPGARPLMRRLSTVIGAAAGPIERALSQIIALWPGPASLTGPFIHRTSAPIALLVAIAWTLSWYGPLAALLSGLHSWLFAALVYLLGVWGVQHVLFRHQARVSAMIRAHGDARVRAARQRLLRAGDNLSERLMERSLLPILRERLNLRLIEGWSTRVGAGLIQAPTVHGLDDPAFEVSSSAFELVRRRMREMGSGIIAIVGPAGGGGSTLIRAVCAEQAAIDRSGPLPTSSTPGPPPSRVRRRWGGIAPTSSLRLGAIFLATYGLVLVLRSMSLGLPGELGIGAVIDGWMPQPWASATLLTAVLITGLVTILARPWVMVGLATLSGLVIALHPLWQRLPPSTDAIASSLSPAQVVNRLDWTLVAGVVLTVIGLLALAQAPSSGHTGELAPDTHPPQRRPVIIGIEELPGTPSDFLKELRVASRHPATVFVVAVPETVMVGMEEAVDEVIQVRYLRFEEAKRLLRRHVLGLPIVFQALAFVSCGGPARELLRAARSIVERRHLTTIGWISTALMRRRLMGRIESVLAMASAPDAGLDDVVRWCSRIQPDTVTAPGLIAHCLQAPEFGAPSDENGNGSNGSQARLLGELAADGYFCATVMEFFSDELDESMVRRAESSADRAASFDHLAAGRQALSVTPELAWTMVSAFREAWDLQPEAFPLDATGSARTMRRRRSLWDP